MKWSLGSTSKNSFRPAPVLPRALRRWISMGSFCFALAMLHLGCTRGAPQGPYVNFFYWKPQQPGPIEEVLSGFEKETGITVIRHTGSESSTQYYRELTTKLRNHDAAADVFFLDVIWPAELAARGYLADLDDVIPPAQRGSYFAGPLTACTVKGKLVAAPFTVDVGVLYYRKDLLEKYGLAPPSTWSELVSEIDEILAKEGATSPDLTGYAAQFARYEGLVCNVQEFLASRGASYVDAEGEPAVTDPRVVSSVRWIRDELLHDVRHPRRASRALLNAKEQESRDIFARGAAIFLRSWPETWKILADPNRSQVAGRVGMAPLPHFTGGEPATTLGGWEIGVASYSSRSSAARRLVEYLSRDAVQRRLAVGMGQTMARRPIYEDPQLLEKLPYFGRSGPWGAPLVDACRSAVPRPRLVRYNAVSDRLQQYIHAALVDADSDIPSLMTECAKQMRREMTGE